MRFITVNDDEVVMAFTSSEISFLCNAINESLQAVREKNYTTRTGFTSDAAMELYRQIEPYA